METIGIAFALAFALGSRDPFPPPAAVIWSLAAGIAGIAGLLVFYRALAAGAMSLVAPVAAVVGAGLPVVAGYAFGERLGGGQAAGILAALAAVILVSRPADVGGGDRRGTWLALVAGLGFAAYFVGMDRAMVAGAGTWWPVPIARAGSIVVTGLGVLVTGQGRDLPRVTTPVVLVAGVGDIVGNLGFVLARAQGPLGPAAVVASLYPAVTVVMAWLLLDERLSRAHVAAVALAIAGIVLIALPV
jgi:drug/metabolite transporter (DMT)-like permease